MIFIDGFAIDASISESHDFPSEVTMYPVESGADISDHVRNLPATVRLDCIVSNTPIGEVAELRREGSVPANDAYEVLIAIRDAREPVVIEDSLQRWENMVLKDLGVPRSATTGDALHFTAEFQQIEVKSNIRLQSRVSVPRAEKKRNLGHRPSPKTPGSSDTAQGQSGNVVGTAGGGQSPSGGARVLVASKQNRQPIRSGGSATRRKPINAGGSGPSSQGRKPIRSGGSAKPSEKTDEDVIKIAGIGIPRYQ